MPGGIVGGLALVIVPSLIPAVGFLVARGRVGLLLVAALGLLIAFLEVLAAVAINPSAPVIWVVAVVLIAALLASMIAIVVLLILSHETPPPSDGSFFDIPWPEDD